MAPNHANQNAIFRTSYRQHCDHGIPEVIFVTIGLYNALKFLYTKYLVWIRNSSITAECINRCVTGSLLVQLVVTSNSHNCLPIIFKEYTYITISIFPRHSSLKLRLYYLFWYHNTFKTINSNIYFMRCVSYTR